MSSLNVRLEPWAAFPSKDTTILQLENGLRRFPDLRIQVDAELEVSLVIARPGATPPATDELASAIYAGDAELIVSEDTGAFELPDIADLYDQEAKDRHFEDDADRDMVGDDVDLGITNIGNK